MKTKLTFFLLVLIGIIWACDKDEYSDKDVLDKEEKIGLAQDSAEMAYLKLRDSLNRVGGIVDYTVSLVNAGNSGYLKSTKNTSLENIIICATQGGKSHTDTTGVGGMAVFTDMRVGTISISIKSEQFTGLNFVADITPKKDKTNSPLINYDGSYYDVRRYVSTMVPVFPLSGAEMGIIKGQLTYESDFTNELPEPVVNTVVSATIDVESPSFKKRFLNLNIGGNQDAEEKSSYPGTILQIAYNDLVSKSTTDEKGTYNISVPATADGLDFILQVGDVSAEQTLYLNTLNGRTLGVEEAKQSIRTIFSTDNQELSLIPSVPSVFVEFGQPEGDLNFQPSVEAQATAILTDSGLEIITVENPGYGYTQTPTVIIKSNENGIAPRVAATASAILDNQGRITSINILNKGEGYINKYPPHLELRTNETNSEAKAIVSYSVAGTYTDGKYVINTNVRGNGYSQNPIVSIAGPTESNGIRATAEANLTGSFKRDYNFLVEPGSNYTDPNEIEVNVVNRTADGSGGRFEVELEPKGSIAMVELPSGCDEYYESLPTVEVAPGNGADASLKAVLMETGRIKEVKVDTDDNGSKYDPNKATPVVTVKGDGYGASVTLSINADSTVSVATYSTGQGYTNIPQYFITNVDGNNGEKPKLNISIEKLLKEIVVENGGNNFDVTLPVKITFDNKDLPCGSPKYIIGRPIKSIKVKNSAGSEGEDYMNAEGVELEILDNNELGSGATTKTVLDYGVKSITITNPGSGYYKGNQIPKISIESPSDEKGENAKLQLDANDLGKGRIEKIKIYNPGKGYKKNPIVSLENGVLDGMSSNKNAMIGASANASGGLAFSINEAGSGYTGDFDLKVNTFREAAVAKAQPYLESGKIQSITITNPGEGYTVVPHVVFWAVDEAGNRIAENSQPYGTGAEGTVEIEDGRVKNVSITVPGEGYYYAPDVELIIQDELEVAEGYAIVDQTTGRVKSVVVENGGKGYTKTPIVQFKALDAKGEGAEGVAFIKDGMVTKVAMTKYGEAYLNCNKALNTHAFFTGNKTGLAGIAPKVITGGAQLGGTNGDSSKSFVVKSGSTVISDIYLGTGKRVIE